MLAPGARSLACAAGSSMKLALTATLLATCAITALLGLRLGQLAPVPAADRPQPPATARRAAHLLTLSLEEDAGVAAGWVPPRRAPDLFALRPRGEVVLAAAAAGRSAHSGATNIMGLGAARTARASALADAAPYFDWRAYLAYYPELRAKGIVTEELAREHYARQGRIQVPLRCAPRAWA